MYNIGDDRPLPDTTITLDDGGRIHVDRDSLAALIVENVRDKLIESSVYTDPTETQIFEELTFWSNGYLGMRAVPIPERFGGESR